ncbi:MAG: hypothetical protein ACK4GN_06630 [Runella sp.]
MEFSIPTSAAFDLLGVTPAQVVKPGNIRDFKVDWSFASWRLKPNIAIQAQPVWELFYNRPTLEKYQKAKRWQKTLSTLDVSGGTIEDENLKRRLAVATKITLFRSHDPLDEIYLFESLTDRYRKRYEEIVEQSKILKDSLLKTPVITATLDTRNTLIEQIQSYENEMVMLEKSQKEAIIQQANKYLKDHWNASFLDIAFGKSFSYDNVRLDSLRLTDDGTALWVNGCVGIGRKWLISGVFRYTQFQRAFARTTQEYFWGVSLRYGSPKFNFFVELIERTRNRPFQLNGFTIAYGGDWRFSRNVLLSYGVRTVIGTNLTLNNLIPIASLSCMMR